MIPIPEELLEQIERGNVLLFIGERIVLDAKGRAVLDQLTAQLAARCETTDAEEYAFPEVAQIYEDEKGRQALVQFIRDQLEASGDEPQQAHHLIAGLTDCNVLATTCLNRRLERAFEEAGRPFDVIIGNVDVALEDERKAQLYKLRGSVERAESLVLTEDDYETFLEDQASISVVLQGYLARKTILFVGYDLADPHFKRLYRKVTAPLDDFARRAYAFGETPPPKVCRWCKRHGIKVVEVDATTFLEALTEQLAARARPAPVVPPRPLEKPSPPLPERPYKLLDYYEAKDETIFFGRREETQRLASLIHAHRLVLLYGASGTGKTSLLLAGVVPRLERAGPPYETIYVRALKDPALVIRRRVRRRLPPKADLPEDGSLVDFLDAATKALDRTLVIVLDQFEEFFIRLSPQFRAAFIEELGTLYDARDVPVKVVLSLREDWLAKVNEIEERIPEVFRIRMRLLPLSRDQADQAITAPVEPLGVRYERELVRQLLDDLMGSEDAAVMPPQLQLVCSALYDGLRPDERLITLTAYERLGGAQGVLERYLDDALALLGSDERALARGALEELVTSQDTKAPPKAGDELGEALEVTVSELEPVLEKLMRARLLRVLEREDGETAYELAHEYLIRKIGLGAEAQARKQAEELIQQELESWKRFGFLMAADKLALVGEVRDMLRRLDPEAQELLLRSALQVGHEVDYWLKQVSDPARRVAVLAEVARSKLAVVRRRAAEALGTQDIPEAVEPLLELAVHETERSVRAEARKSLAKLSAQHAKAVARLQSEMENADRGTRRAIRETLATLPLRSLPTDARPAALAIRWRRSLAAFAKGASATAARHPVRLAVVLVLVLIVFAYAFSASAYYLGWRGDTVVIRRGHPALKLPGLGRVVVDTGIQQDQVAMDYWPQIDDNRLWGFWPKTTDGGYQQWGQLVYSTTLSLEYALSSEGSLSLLWYLNQKEGLAALSALIASDLDYNVEWGLSALAQFITVHPDELPAEDVAAALDRVMIYEATYIPVSYMYDLYDFGLMVTAQPELTLPDDDIVHLVKLLDSESPERRTSAAYVLAMVVLRDSKEVSPEVAQRVSQTLLMSLQSKDVNFRNWTERIPNIADILGQMVVKNNNLANPPFVADLMNVVNSEYGYNRTQQANAAYVLGEVASFKREVADKPLANRFVELLDPDYPNEYNSTLHALRQLVLADPTLASPVAQALIAQLGDYVRGLNTADALVRVIPSTTEAISQISNELDPLIRSGNPETRAKAAHVLGQLVTAHPEVARSEMVTRLASLLVPESDTHVSLGVSRDRFEASYALAMISAADSDLVPTHVVDQALEILVEVLDDYGSSGDCLRAAFALGQLVAAVPDLADEEMAKDLVNLLWRYNSGTRVGAAYVLGRVAAANPEVILPAIDTFEDLWGAWPGLDVPEEITARIAYNLGQRAGRSSKTPPEPTAYSLMQWLIYAAPDDDDFSKQAFRAAYVVGELAAAHAAEDAHPGATEPLFFYLTNPLDSQERTMTAELLFLEALHDPSRTDVISDTLTQLADRREPHVRIAANETLQMLEIADLAHTAASDVNQWDEITRNFRNFASWRQVYLNFFGEDFNWAAQKALSWLEQQSSAED